MLEEIGAPQRWRPHVKSTKSPLVWREIVRAGVRRFKCATLREARELCAMLEAHAFIQGRGAFSLLVAYLRRQLGRLVFECGIGWAGGTDWADVEAAFAKYHCAPTSPNRKFNFVNALDGRSFYIDFDKMKRVSSFSS